MSTTVKTKIGTVEVKSDQPGLEERLAKYALELSARETEQAAADGAWQIPEFVQRCLRQPSQKKLIRFLVEKGRVTRQEMIKAAGKASGSELAGCRGSVSKNAKNCKLPSNWWQDSRDERTQEHVTELRADIREALKKELARVDALSS